MLFWSSIYPQHLLSEWMKTNMELLQPVSGRGVYSEINLHLGKKIFNFSQIRSGSADIHTLNKYPSSPPIPLCACACADDIFGKINSHILRVGGHDFNLWKKYTIPV